MLAELPKARHDTAVERFIMTDPSRRLHEHPQSWSSPSTEVRRDEPPDHPQSHMALPPLRRSIGSQASNFQSSPVSHSRLSANPFQSASAPPFPAYHHHTLSGGPSSPLETLTSFPKGFANPHSTISSSSNQPAYTQASPLAYRRAFRQRRKDPSCDACRERKVKCDATDSVSCSECASRGVKCQFTKDTNRRMSSIKQVQDLERQLSAERMQRSELNAQISRLRIMLGMGEPQAAGARSNSPSAPMSSNLPPPFPPSPQARTRTSQYDAVRNNIRKYARGIFMPPVTYTLPECSQVGARDPELPPRPLSDDLLSSFHDSFHLNSPVIDWPSFLARYKDCYQTSTLRSQPHVVVALLFSVLGIGSLQSQACRWGSQDSQTDGALFYEQSVQYLGRGKGSLTLDHCRVALMLSVYCMETNSRPMCRTWLATALAFATELGLHQEPREQSDTDGEMRKIVWFSIYTRDRFLALEIARPLQIDEDDCKVDIGHAHLSWSFQTVEHQLNPHARNPHPLELASALAQVVARMKKSLGKGRADCETIKGFNRQLDEMAAALPEPLHPGSTKHLDPSLLWLATAVSNTRLILHRQNMSPAASTSERVAALNQCAAAAQTTARCISRTMQAFPASPRPYTDPRRSSLDWQSQVRSFTPSLLCTHLWRCILILCLAHDFAAAATCINLSATIGKLRPINEACGRNVVFFLSQLRNRTGEGRGQRHQLEQDEEMIAYASADLQGDPAHAWIWETEGGRGGSESDAVFRPAWTEPPEPPSLLEATSEDCDGWQKAETLLRAIQEEQEQRHVYGRLSSMRATGEGESSEAPAWPEQRRASETTTERISIASIIESKERTM